ncbi:hypothetical protein N9204_00275 [bacterium]|nr:hypothetical protein [bacterium]
MHTLTITKIHFRNETGWTIAGTNDCTIKGVIPWEVKENDRVKINGDKKRSDYNGAIEIAFTECQIDIPEDSRALLAYAVSQTKGLGASKEEAIWAKYGKEWKTVKTLEIKGINDDIQWAWTDTLSRLKHQAGMTQGMAFLISHGCTQNMSEQAWKLWEENTVSTVQADPYALADLPRYGFVQIDSAIRRSFGIEDTDDRRRDAATLYAIKKNGDSGNTAIEKGNVADLIRDMGIPLDEAELTACFERLTFAKKIYDGGGFVCLLTDWENENAIWERFAA